MFGLFKNLGQSFQREVFINSLSAARQNVEQARNANDYQNCSRFVKSAREHLENAQKAWPKCEDTMLPIDQLPFDFELSDLKREIFFLEGIQPDTFEN